MALFEYKVVPAPTRGDKVKGVKQPEARFAHSVEAVLNQMAESGWEFVRAEMLPSEERSGISKTSREWRNLLVFRRERSGAARVEPVVTTAAQPVPQSVPQTEPPLSQEPVVAVEEATAEVPAPEHKEEPKVLRAVEPGAEEKPAGAILAGIWRDRS